MPKPLAICIEDLDAQSVSKYLRCVALPGRQPGLRLDEIGRVLWQSDDGVSCELWVSADGRLVLYRPETNIPVTLHRVGRSLDVPCDKPVIVIDQDQIDVGARHLRIHIHGQASSVAAPSLLPSRSRQFSRLAQAAATAAIIGTVAATGGCTDSGILATPTIEVIEYPPEPVMPPPPEITTAEIIQGGWIVAQTYNATSKQVQITGTLTIEENFYIFTPTREITGTSVQGYLGFLFDNPRGEVMINYYTSIDYYDDFDRLEPGYPLADCVFSIDSVMMGQFQVKKENSNSLYLHSLESEDGLWSITKQLEIDTEQ
ncbi:MAG: hypothetical protein GY832_37140 [Chloroflexi bacterium]|nr:hypothetical protein [Chloroflexota bacterium]